MEAIKQKTKARIPVFYKRVLGIPFALSFAIWWSARTCGGGFCGLIVIYIPPIWIIALVSAAAYFIGCRKGMSVEKSENVALIAGTAALIACFAIAPLIFH